MKPKTETTAPTKLHVQHRLPRKDGWVVVTPDLARAWLAVCNVANRKMKKNHLTKLVRDLQNNYWITNKVEPIAFDTNQQLLDGQHRLAAVAASGIPVKLWVLVNQPPEIRRILDTGEMRKAHEILHMEGVPNASWVTTVINLLLRIEKDKLWNPRTSTVADMRKYLEQNPDISRQVGSVGSTVLRQLYKSIAAPCACYCAFHRKYPEQTEAFFRDLRTGVADNPEAPVAALRNYLITVDPKMHPRITLNQKVIATYRAFLAYVKGERLKKFKVSENDPLPVIA